MEDTTREDGRTVVVIGAGLGGSAAAAFLARGGVDVTLLERHEEATRRPRAWVVSPRTLEVLRELGIADEVLRRGSAGSWSLVTTPTLLSAQPGEAPRDEADGLSALGSARLDQDVLEEILRSAASDHGARIRWGATVTGIDDHGDGAHVRLADGTRIAARYVVVADGARSALGAGLGIASDETTGDGPTSFPSFDQVLFRSPELDELMAGIPGSAFLCTEAEMIVFRRDLGRWQLQRQGGAIDDPQATVDAAAGRHVAIELLDHSSWTPAARSARSYRQGNVFLVGDAAHAFPPSLGMGGNLAVDDAHDLAWKLAWVLDGRAGERLLDSYDEERKPVGDLVLEASVALARGERRPDLLTVQLGIGYPAGISSALIGEGTEATMTDPRAARPVVGARFPHHALPDGRSSVDLTTIDTFAAVGREGQGPSDVPYTRLPSVADPGPSAVWLLRPDGHLAARVAVDGVRDALDAILDRRG